MSARGIIKLSAYQAEGRLVISAVRCLIFVVLAAMLIISVKLIHAEIIKFICFMAIILFAIYRRTMNKYKSYGICKNYLHSESERNAVEPSKLRLFGFGIFITALRISVICAMMSPSVICIYEGAVSYSMSGMRIRPVLMLGAAFCFAVSGAVFAAITVSCLAGAEYIYFSGIRRSPLSAAELSMQRLMPFCGEYISLNFLSLFRLGVVRELCRFNFTEKILSDIDNETEMDYTCF